MAKKKEPVEKEPKKQYFLIEKTSIGDIWIINNEGYDTLGDLEDNLQYEDAFSKSVDKERFMVICGSLYELKDTGFIYDYAHFVPMDDEENDD